MATIKDVAQLAGVSMSTVSKYLNGGHVRAENIPLIRDAIATLDYRVNPFARSLKTQRNRSVGVLLPDLSAPFYNNVFSALDSTLREQGYHTLICCYRSDHGLERDNLKFLIANGVDGLIYMPEDLSAEEYNELTSNCGIPIVQVDRFIAGIESDAILVNNADSVYHAVSHLIESGHRRIGIITGPKSVYTAKERLVGYLRALSDHNIPYDDQLVISDVNSFSLGHQGCESFLQLADPPTAVFSSNYDITLGLVTAAQEHGLRIPEDMDIFGFDCSDICGLMHPPIPMVHQPEEEIGNIAANYLLERLGGYAGPPRTTRLSCRVIPENIL